MATEYRNLTSKLGEHVWAVLAYTIGLTLLIWGTALAKSISFCFAAIEAPMLATAIYVLSPNKRLRIRLPIVWIGTATIAAGHAMWPSEIAGELAAATATALILYSIAWAMARSLRRVVISVRDGRLVKSIVPILRGMERRVGAFVVPANPERERFAQYVSLVRDLGNALERGPSVADVEILKGIRERLANDRGALERTEKFVSRVQGLHSKVRRYQHSLTTGRELSEMLNEVLSDCHFLLREAAESAMPTRACLDEVLKRELDRDLTSLVSLVSGVRSARITRNIESQLSPAKPLARGGSGPVDRAANAAYGPTEQERAAVQTIQEFCEIFAVIEIGSLTSYLAVEESRALNPDYS